MTTIIVASVVVLVFVGAALYILALIGHEMLSDNYEYRVELRERANAKAAKKKR